MKNMKRLLSVILCVLMSVEMSHAQTVSFNVKDYGARGNGKRLDSPAIQRAIDACHRAGGGTVIVPPGTYLSATVELKDNDVASGKGCAYLGYYRL